MSDYFVVVELNEFWSRGWRGWEKICLGSFQPVLEYAFKSQAYIKPCVLGDEEKPAFWE